MSERSLQDLKDHCKKRKKHRDRCLPPFCFCFAFFVHDHVSGFSTGGGKEGSSQVLFAFKMAELEGTLGPEIIVKFYVLD